MRILNTLCGLPTVAKAWHPALRFVYARRTFQNIWRMTYCPSLEIFADRGYQTLMRHGNELTAGPSDITPRFSSHNLHHIPS